MSLQKKVIAVFLVLVFIFIIYLAAAFAYLNFNKLESHNPKATTVRLYPKENSKQLLNKLAEKYDLNFTSVLRFYLRLTKVGRKLQVGEYSVTPDTTAFSLLEKVRKGDVVHHDVTFIEGDRFSDMLHTLQSDKYLEHKYTNNKELMAYLGSSKENPEGLFYPDTYQFHWPQSDLDLLRRSYQKMQTVLNKAWANRDNDVPYKNPYQALVMASLLEKETAIPEERREIAGVLVLRMQKKMRLQVDPTVTYGLGKPADHKLTRADLRKVTPYNTYRMKGLPPTPIDMPSKSSIIAAMHPIITGNLFYVAKGDGSHVFSKTYAEHKAAIEKYLK